MWANPQETAELVTLLKESFMENFIFCVVTDVCHRPNNNFLSVSFEGEQRKQ